MSDEIANMKITALPEELVIKVANASAFGACMIPVTDDGPDTLVVSCYEFFEDICTVQEMITYM